MNVIQITQKQITRYFHIDIYEKIKVKLYRPCPGSFDFHLGGVYAERSEVLDVHSGQALRGAQTEHRPPSVLKVSTYPVD